MTIPRDPDRMIRAFLADGAERLPDPVYDAVRAEIDTKRQRAVIGPWRVPAMNKLVPVGLGIAAVVAVVVIGSQVMRPTEPTGVGGQPVVSPVPSPTPAPSVARLPLEGPIAAGTYLASDGQSSIRITLPDGWVARAGGIDLRKHVDEPGELSLIIFRPDINVFADACRTTERPPTTGPAVNDLVEALQAQAGTDVSEPQPLVVEGGTGVSLTLTVPAGFDYASCPDRAAKVWSSITGSNWLAFGESPNGEAQSTTISIVDGPDGRVVYAPSISPGASAADRAELDAIIASIALESAP